MGAVCCPASVFLYWTIAGWCPDDVHELHIFSPQSWVQDYLPYLGIKIIYPYLGMKIIYPISPILGLRLTPLPWVKIIYPTSSSRFFPLPWFQ